MIKLICLDIDGTLLNSNHELSEQNIVSIKKAVDKGVKVTIATGRMLQSAYFFGQKIGINAPIITMNGAYVKDFENNKEVANHPFKREELVDLIAVLDKFNLKPNIYNMDTMFVSENINRYQEMNKAIPMEQRYKIKEINESFTYDDLISEHGDEILKAITFPELSDKALIKEKVLEKHNLSVVESHYTNLEFTSSSATKGNAVLELAEYFGFNNDEVMTVGDSENDLSMIKAVENSVAMGNASDIIKKYAKHLTKTNDENGVSYIIEKLVIESEF